MSSWCPHCLARDFMHIATGIAAANHPASCKREEHDRLKLAVEGIEAPWYHPLPTPRQLRDAANGPWESK